MTGPNDAPPSRAYGRDYALINGVFAVGLSGLAVRLHRRGLEEPLTPREMTELALATFALADVFSHEKIAHWVREPFVEETADNRPGRPRGSGLRYAIGELMSCSRCVENDPRLRNTPRKTSLVRSSGSLAPWTRR